MGGHDRDNTKPDEWKKIADYADIKLVERLAILRRRNVTAGIEPRTDYKVEDPIPDLVGVALSGGGIRSASFCLGALQALEAEANVIGRADYLSTVSGGGYIGASMIAAMTAGRPPEKNKEKKPAGSDTSQKARTESTMPAAKAEAETAEAAAEEEAAEGEIETSAAKAKEAKPETAKRRYYFPFNQDKPLDLRDMPDVGHIRDNSRYLFPKGIDDILKSWGILFRGLAVNVILVLAVILPLATATIVANPTYGHLGRSFAADVCAWPSWTPIFNWFLPAKWELSPHWNSPVWCFQNMSDRFFLTKATLLLVFGLLALWGLILSLMERGKQREDRNPDYRSRMAWVLNIALIVLAPIFIAELQTLVLEQLIDGLRDGMGVSLGRITTFVGGLGGVSATLALFRQQLTNVVANAMGGDSYTAFVKVATAKLGLYIAALFMPLVVYASYLVISAVGIAVPDWQYYPPPDFTYPLLPDWLAAQIALRWIFLIVLVLTIVIVIGQAIRNWESWKSSVFYLAYAKILSEPICTFLRLLLIIGYVAFLYVVAEATRLCLPNGGNWEVLLSYLWLSSTLLIISMAFTENANGLHALYRDRLNAAFQLGKAGEEGNARTEPLPLPEIDSDLAPYLLINATLNATRFGDEAAKKKSDAAQTPSAAAATSSTPQANNTRPNKKQEAQRKKAEERNASEEKEKNTRDELQSLDPARRGRRAEFFLFSKYFTGSDATGYAYSGRFTSPRKVDLATAVAISGAAVSSNSGRIVPAILSPTIALLNLRLGYWLQNPQYRYLSRAGSSDIPNWKWTEIFRLYLLQEAFGMLRTSSRKLLLSDGGHIDNIGLYQLLRRRCKVIIVIDAEADPAMNFGALADAQRFARIDLGHRIQIDWFPIRNVAQARNADRTRASTVAEHDQHFAIGRIIYSQRREAPRDAPQEEGILLYFKANVTGDEPDYVLDYERRYPTFPHETTLDQFFSEEQMEAYRALGFHTVSRALAGNNKAVSSATRMSIEDLKNALARKPYGLTD